MNQYKRAALKNSVPREAIIQGRICQGNISSFLPQLTSLSLATMDRVSNVCTAICTVSFIFV